MFLVKDGTLAQNKPVTTNDWPYPVDPNYNKTKEDADYATYITDNFTQKKHQASLLQAMPNSIVRKTQCQPLPS